MSNPKSENPTEFPNRRLAWFVDQLNLRRETVANKVGISRTYLSSILTGQAPLSQKTLRAFEAAFRLCPRWVQSGGGPYMIGEDGPVYVTGDIYGAPAGPEALPVIIRAAYHCGQCHREVPLYATGCPNCGTSISWTPLFQARDPR